MFSEPVFNSSELSLAEMKAIETFYRAFSEKTPDLLDEACARDWQDIPLAPGQGPGPEGLKKQIPRLLLAFPDMQIVVHEIVGSNSRAGVRASIIGTHTGEIFGIAPTGQIVNVALHEFHHLKHGQITHTWHLEDWFGMLNNVGVWPPTR